MKPIAAQAARSVAAAFDLTPPPVDVTTLAHNLGVVEIRHSALVEDGRLERTNGETRILLRDGISAERQRFTIAHEIAHLILSDPDSDLVAKRHHIGQDKEERFCEDFAAALLLPHDWVITTAGHRPVVLHTVRIVAGRSNTSLAAACVRLNEVAGWNRTLMHWRRINHRWGFRWAAGLPHGFDNQIRSSDKTGRTLNDASATAADTHIDLPLRIGKDEVIIPAQISVRRDSALALGDLSAIPQPADHARQHDP